MIGLSRPNIPLTLTLTLALTLNPNQVLASKIRVPTPARPELFAN